MSALPAAAWGKSSFCTTASCVEVAHQTGVVYVRDTKVENGPVLAFSTEEWAAFVAGVKVGEFD